MIKRILDFIYPRRCVLCRSSCPPDAHLKLDLCPACQNDLPQIESACYQCGIPLTHTESDQLCGQCLKKAPRYDRVISLFHYQNPLSWLIQQMKFHNKISLANLLAQLMSQQLLQHREKNNLPEPDVIIPVPLHFKRQYQRQFNQAEELARFISKSLNYPLDRQFIERHVDNSQQSGLNAKQRKKNVKGVFRIKNKKQKRYQHVVIIDDVMSTGSTVNEIAGLLKKAGIKKVDVWVLARASRH